MGASYDWFLFCFPSIEKVARVLLTNHRAKLSKIKVRVNRPLSLSGHVESQENKKLCRCTASLALNSRLGEDCPAKQSYYSPETQHGRRVIKVYYSQHSIDEHSNNIYTETIRSLALDFYHVKVDKRAP